jgi:hypothetical protein
MMRLRGPSALLLAVSAALLLTSCAAAAAADHDGASPPTPAPAASSADQSAPPTDAPAEPVPVDPAQFAATELGTGVVFASPSGALRCGITTFDVEYLWGCRIDEKAWEFPSEDPADYCYESQVPCGWGIEALGTGETHPRKRGDVAFESEFRTDTPVLESGTSIAFADVTCISDEHGITCSHAISGHGFTISASVNEIW